MELWLERVALHIAQGAAKEDILQSLSIVQRAATYMIDSTGESVRTVARTAALVNSGHWLKN